MATVTHRALAPHPKDVPILGSVPAFVRDTPKTFVDGWHEVGDLVRFRGLRTMTLAAHPDHVKHVLNDRFENYPRSERVVEKLSVLLGQSLFTAEGEAWKVQARAVHPLLRTGRSFPYASAVTDAAQDTGRRWDSAQSVDLMDEMTLLSIDTAARMLFGPDRGGGPFDEFVQAAKVANEYAIAGVMAVGGPPDVAIRPAYRRYLAAIGHLDSVVNRVIAARRREPGDDFVSALVTARDPETGDQLTDRQVRDESITFLHTTYSGVSSALLWSWYVLATNGAVADRVRGELEGALAGAPPTADSLDRLPYLGLVLKEVLRLYPSLWIFARQTREDDEIGGYRIPAGMAVVLCPWITHRHPEFWSSPEEFEPERFLPERQAGRHPYAYFPWAGGPRGCPAEDLATSIVALALATLAPRYRVDLVPGHTTKRVREFVLRPANGLPAKIASR